MKKALILLIVVSLFSFLYAQKGTRQCNHGYYLICTFRNINTCYWSFELVIYQGSIAAVTKCTDKVPYCEGDNSHVECKCI